MLACKTFLDYRANTKDEQTVYILRVAIVQLYVCLQEQCEKDRLNQGFTPHMPHLEFTTIVYHTCLTCFKTSDSIVYLLGNTANIVICGPQNASCRSYPEVLFKTLKPYWSIYYMWICTIAPKFYCMLIVFFFLRESLLHTVN